MRSPSTTSRSRRVTILCFVVPPLLLAVKPLEAIDLSGAAIVSATATDNRGVESDTLEQRYSLNLAQALTPYLNLRFAYSHYDFGVQLAEGGESSRLSREPRLDILYGRREVSAQLSVGQRFAGFDPGEDFEIRSIRASLGWRPTNALRFSLNLRDETNVAEEAVFGRDNNSQLAHFRASYSRRYWNGSYTFRLNTVDNRVSDLRSDQTRHELRLNGARAFMNNRLNLRLGGSLSQIDRETQLGSGADPAEPIPASQGLFVVDTSPEIGELEPTPGLIDGDTVTPSPPGIDIGGANTFRNVGVDLGLTRSATRLEVYVDTVSSPGLVWQVYHSRDNLVWENVGGVIAEWDPSRLLYTLRFPETEDRFFKAVNVSVNGSPLVQVTEVRALIDVDVQPGEERFDSTFYRLTAGADFRPHRRVQGRLDLGYNTEEDFANGFVRRDFTGAYARLGLTFDLARDWRFDVSYAYDDSENLRDPVLLRTLDTVAAKLTWTPLPTVDAVLSASQRDETEEGELLQSSSTIRFYLRTDLLPDLKLISDVSFARLDDPFSGSDRDTWGWRESLSATPWRRWTFNASLSYQLFETQEGEPLRDRIQFDFNTVWNATPFLTLSAILSWIDNDGRSNLRQTYSASYSPGSRLSLTATYQEFETFERRATTNGIFGVTYRLNRHVGLFGNLTRSRFDVVDGAAEEVNSGRIGLQLSF